MAFIYAVNGESILSAAVLEKAELGKILGEPGKMQTVSSLIGPGGGQCLLFGNLKACNLRYKPEEQFWMESYNGKYYIGHYLDELPTEKELARSKQLAGHQVELGGGAKWLIPVARKFAEGCALPVSLALGTKGEIISKSLPEYAKFSRRAELFYFDTLKQWGEMEGAEQLDIEARLLLAMDAISFNYQVGLEEIRMLKLIQTTNFSEILEAILDLPTIKAVNKQAAEAKKKGKVADTRD